MRAYSLAWHLRNQCLWITLRGLLNVLGRTSKLQEEVQPRKKVVGSELTLLMTKSFACKSQTYILYKIKDNKFNVSGKTNDLMNQRIKRESKKRAQEMEQHLKSKNKYDKLQDKQNLGILTTWFCEQKCLEELVQKATKPFKYTKNNYTTVVNSTEGTTASVLSLCAIDNVLRNARLTKSLP